MMAFSIYKPGQGFWTRTLTAIGGGAIVLSGVAWLFRQLQGLENDLVRVITQSTISVITIVFFFCLFWYLLNKPKIADFMIATEAEMRKVNWPTRSEIIGSTLVVIVGTALMAMFLWLINMFSAWFFELINVLG